MTYQYLNANIDSNFMILKPEDKVIITLQNDMNNYIDIINIHIIMSIVLENKS